MYKENDIFYDDNEYHLRAEFCNNNGYYIQEISPDEKGRRFQIKKQPEPTEEQILFDLRFQREYQCFPIINRGQLWYSNLSEQQLVELKEWYKAWLDVTETKVIPEIPEIKKMKFQSLLKRKTLKQNKTIWLQNGLATEPRQQKC